ARRRTWVDYSTRGFTYLAASLPAFLVADFLVRSVINAHHWWFQIGPPTGGVAGWFQHMTLPAIALAVGLVGAYTRYVRSSMMVSLTEPYTTVARGKGLPERQVLFRHALRNSLIPVTALLSLEVGAVIGSSLVADAVFGLGGLASSFLFALGQSDPFQLTALVVTMAIVVSFFLPVADVLVVVLAPRPRH